jgi:hypothetical protein
VQKSTRRLINSQHGLRKNQNRDGDCSQLAVFTKKVVITPPALDTPWRDEGKDFGLTAANLADVVFMNYNEAARITDPLEFEGKIVLCDEAHWLLDIVPKNSLKLLTVIFEHPQAH